MYDHLVATETTPSVREEEEKMFVDSTCLELDDEKREEEEKEKLLELIECRKTFMRRVFFCVLQQFDVSNKDEWI